MIWYNLGHKGKGWVKTKWAKADMGADAYLVCPGPSLKDLDIELRGRGRKVFAINTAYPKVKPDIWMGLDKVECYDRSLWAEPFIKVCRGGDYRDMAVEGKPLKYFDNVYFAGTKAPEKGKTMFDYRDHDDLMCWYKNTMASALHLIVWMGGRRIHFVGCDMGGLKDYHDDRVLTDKQRDYNRRLYRSQVDFLKEHQKLAKQYGIEFISCTPGSPLNEFMEYKELDIAIKNSEARVSVASGEIKHCLDANKKVGVVVPTRNDRPEFLKACREMIKYQTTKPDGVYIIDCKPKTEYNDQRERVAEGVEKAKKDGMTHIIIMEDDDYYSPNYIKKVLSMWTDEHIVGGYYYNIYHLKDRERVVCHMDMSHGNISQVCPLHSTSFTVAFWDNFIGSGLMGAEKSLDLEMWTWAKKTKAKIKLIFDPDLVISIKHGMGKTGGGNHAGIKKGCGVPDPDMEYLSKLVDPKIIKTYKRI